jgi:hypothetical protein
MCKTFAAPFYFSNSELEENEMSYDRVGINKLRDNPEAFVIFWVHETGVAFLRLPNDFTEAGVRSVLVGCNC